MNDVHSLDTGSVAEAAHSLHMGVLYISLTNLLIIVVMVVVFILALLLPFPHRASVDTSSTLTHDEETGADGATP
jgi:hypothetical protein